MAPTAQFEGTSNVRSAKFDILEKVYYVSNDVLFKEKLLYNFKNQLRITV